MSAQHPTSNSTGNPAAAAGPVFDLRSTLTQRDIPAAPALAASSSRPRPKRSRGPPLGTRTPIEPDEGGRPQIQFVRVKVTYNKRTNFVVAGGAPPSPHPALG